MAKSFSRRIEDLRGDGWVFYYESRSGVVSAWHPGGGKIQVISIKARSILIDIDEVGAVLARGLNNGKN